MQRVRKLAKPSRMRVGTWYVGSLMGKVREVVDTMIRRRVNILYVQEMKWKGQKAKEVEDASFKLWYTGNTSTKNGVGIVLNNSLKDGVVDIKREEDRIILVKLLVDLIFNVISAYAPQIGLNESVKMQFWEELDALVSSVLISEKLFIGDLNGHVGSTRVGFDGVHEGFGYGSRNQEGEGILNFALAYDLIVASTLFRKSLSSSNF
jgi:exonuclease III